MQPIVAYPSAEATAARASTGSADQDVGGKWDESLAGLRVDDQRVADVAYRIAVAGAELCPDRAPVAGVVLQSALQYRPTLRPKAMAFFHIDARPTVEVVAAGSPAARAGLQRSDILVSVGGQALGGAAAVSPDTPGSYAPVKRALGLIEGALAAGPARIGVERNGAAITLTVPSEIGCAYDAEVTLAGELQASADGRHVFITSGLVSYARSDDALALVLGHEYAHDLLHHYDRLDRANAARKYLGDLGSSPASLMVAEREADYVGLYLTARAGYDISHAPEIVRSFPAELDWTHPGPKERAASLAATRDEILRKRAASEPLTPNAAAP